MKRLISLTYASIFLLLFSVSSLSKTVTINVGIQDNDASPIIIGNGTELQSPPGIGIDIIKRAAKELGISLNIIRQPNRRIHKGLETGLFDASGFYSYKKDREKEGIYPSIDGKLNKKMRTFVQSYYIYSFPENNISWDGKTMTGVKSIGANSGYSVVAVLRKLNIPVHEAKTVLQNLKMLSANRVQGYAAQASSIDPVIASYDEWKTLVKVGPPVRTKEYYFMFSHKLYKNNKKLANDFWEKIAEVREGVLEEYQSMNIKPELK